VQTLVLEIDQRPLDGRSVKIPPHAAGIRQDPPKYVAISTGQLDLLGIATTVGGVVVKRIQVGSRTHIAANAQRAASKGDQGPFTTR
jgi:hypothetical protein